MRFIKQLFDFYINSSIHVALAVYALSWVTLLTFGLPYDENVLYFNFYATITGYNFVKYFGIAKFHHRELTKDLKIIQVFSLLCFLLLCYYTWLLQLKTLVYALLFGSITFLYAIPLLPKKLYLESKQKLRDISGLKVYVIAVVWSGTTVVLPLINADFTLNTSVFTEFTQRLVFIIALMLPFEIRDLKFDSLKLATIPQKIGVKRTKIAGISLLILFILLEFTKTATPSMLCVSLFIACITGGFIFFSNEKRNRYYSAFFVEAIPILWLLIFKLCQLFF